MDNPAKEQTPRQEEGEERRHGSVEKSKFIIHPYKIFIDLKKKKKAVQHGHMVGTS